MLATVARIWRLHHRAGQQAHNLASHQGPLTKVGQLRQPAEYIFSRAYDVDPFPASNCQTEFYVAPATRIAGAGFLSERDNDVCRVNVGAVLLGEVLAHFSSRPVAFLYQEFASVAEGYVLVANLMRSIQPSGGDGASEVLQLAAVLAQFAPSRIAGC